MDSTSRFFHTLCDRAVRFIGRNVTEIADDPALRWYGVALALGDVITGVFWLTDGHLARIVASNEPAICWPFFASCSAVRVFSPAAMSAVLTVLVAASVVNAAMYSEVSLVRSAYWLMAGLTSVKIGIIMLDYRLILNQHYMDGCIVLSYLLVPEKRRVIPYLLVLMYVWAGTLKWTDDWLTGAALYGRRPLGLPALLIPAACVYVVVLEMSVSFGLLARRAVVFWPSFAQFALFHVASLWVVGFFYPLLMFMLLAMFPLSRRWPGPTVDGQQPRPLVGLWAGRESMITYGVLGAFCCAQIFPFQFPGDRALTGEGRMFALHMFDAPVVCVGTMTITQAGTATTRVTIQPTYVDERIKCDPIVFFSMVKRYCATSPAGQRIGFSLDSARRAGEPLRRIVEVESFCAESVAYTVWRHNWWITAAP